jgi:hypothetical protein
LTLTQRKQNVVFFLLTKQPISIVNLINDPGCVCGWVIEDAIHFFLECCLYVEAREQLTNNLQFLDSLLIETLLFGDDSLSEEQNAQIFKSVQLYIKQTKRFTPQ